MKSSANFNITGGTFNLNSAIPITTTPVVTPPDGDGTYLRVDAANTNLTSTNPFAFGRINNVRFADGFSGANAGAKIAACLTALPSTGGVCDARGLEGSQTVSQDMFSGISKPGILLLGAATFTVNNQQNVPSNWQILGLGPGVTNFVTGGGGLDIFKMTNAANVVLRDFKVTGTGTTGTLESPVYITGSVGTDVNTEVYNLEITNSTYAAVIEFVKNVRFHGNFVHDQVWVVDAAEGYGFVFAQVDAAIVEGNRFNNVPRHSIYFSQGTTNSLAVGNIITNTHMAGIQTNGSDSNNWNDNIGILGNTISGVGDDSGQTAVSTAINILNKSRYVVVAHNEITATGTGVDAGVYVQGNDTDTAQPTGIQVTGGSIVVAGSTANGVLLGRCLDCEVEGAKITGNGSSVALVALNGSATRTGTENVVRNNTLKNSSTGVQMTANVTDTMVDGNTFVDITTPYSDSGVTTRYGFNFHNNLYQNENLFLNPGSVRSSVDVQGTAKATSNNSNEIIGLKSTLRIDPGNTNNWTSSTGLQAFRAVATSGTGATGTATAVNGITISAANQGGTWTNWRAVFATAPTVSVGSIGTKYAFYAETGAGRSDFLDGIHVGTSTYQDGSGLKHRRVTEGCATAGSVGATCDVTISWATAFADNSYTASCSGYGITQGVPADAGMHSKVAASIQFRTVAITATAAEFDKVECIAMHD